MGPTEVQYQHWISEVLISSGSTWTTVTSVGDGGSLMLLLHSFPEFWFSWRHQLKAFCKDYHVAVDMRGYGDMDQPVGSSEYSLNHLT
ncbi:Epoxide hydrolase 4, partial [Geodia barretti]